MQLLRTWSSFHNITIIYDLCYDFKFYNDIIGRVGYSTPLMSACWNNHVSTAKILVENGAVIDLLNKVIDNPPPCTLAQVPIDK